MHFARKASSGMAPGGRISSIRPGASKAVARIIGKATVPPIMPAIKCRRSRSAPRISFTSILLKEITLHPFLIFEQSPHRMHSAVDVILTSFRLIARVGHILSAHAPHELHFSETLLLRNRGNRLNKAKKAPLGHKYWHQNLLSQNPPANSTAKIIIITMLPGKDAVTA
jgi:hypothetical protein